MARTTPSNVSDAVARTAHLLRMKYWTGAVENELRLTDASQDLDVDVGGGVETWTGDGIFLTISQVSENTEFANQSVDISLDGVDQTVISAIMNNFFRGRTASVWRVWLNETTGAVDGVVQIFHGYQNDPYNITATQTDNPDAVNVSTRAITTLTRLSSNRVVLSNKVSHNEMIERDSFFGTASMDEFFRYTGLIINREVIWGDGRAKPYKSGGRGIKLPPEEFGRSGAGP